MTEQRTDAWFAERAGKVTASRIADLMAKTRNGWGASRANYLAQLVAERLTGAVQDSFTSAAMQWGTDQEPAARAAYEAHTGELVEEVGFVHHPDINNCGASPDGLVDVSGLVEIKCPNTATHIDTLLGQGIADKYVKQMQFQMACTGRQWCDFVSFDPRMPDDMQLHVERITRDDTAIEEIEQAVTDFLAEVDQKVSALTERYKEAA